jgi:hypothetical protein
MELKMTHLLKFALAAFLSFGAITASLAQDAYGGIHGSDRSGTAESAR